MTATGESSGLSTQTSFTDAGAFVGNIGTASGRSSGLTSLTINATGGVTAGHSIILAFITGGGTGSSPAPGCLDSVGNTYNLDLDVSNGTNPSLWICSSHNVTALSSSDTITVNFPGTSNAARATANEFSGLVSPLAVDKTQSAKGNSAFPNSGDTATTSQADEILFGPDPVSGRERRRLRGEGQLVVLACRLQRVDLAAAAGVVLDEDRDFAFEIHRLRRRGGRLRGGPFRGGSVLHRALGGDEPCRS